MKKIIIIFVSLLAGNIAILSAETIHVKGGLVRIYKQILPVESSMATSLAGLIAGYASQNNSELPNSWEQIGANVNVNLNDMFKHVKPPFTERFSFIDHDAEIKELNGGAGGIGKGGKLLLINNYIFKHPETDDEGGRFVVYLESDGKMRHNFLSEDQVQSILKKYNITIPPPLSYDPHQHLPASHYSFRENRPSGKTYLKPPYTEREKRFIKEYERVTGYVYPAQDTEGNFIPPTDSQRQEILRAVGAISNAPGSPATATPQSNTPGQSLPVKDPGQPHAPLAAAESPQPDNTILYLIIAAVVLGGIIFVARRKKSE